MIRTRVLRRERGDDISFVLQVFQRGEFFDVGAPFEDELQAVRNAKQIFYGAGARPAPTETVIYDSDTDEVP